MLIENYDPLCFLDLRIKCYQCGSVTSTPDLERGEIPPTSWQFVTLGSGEEDYLVQGTCDSSEGAIYTTAEKVQQLLDLRPRVPSRTRMVDPDLLTRIETTYDQFTGGRFAADAASVRRALEAGSPMAAEEHPLVWACVHIRGRLSAKILSQADPADVYAMASIAAFLTFDEMWSHHPLYFEVCRSFGTARIFNHNMAVFATAGYLSALGQSVGFVVAGANRAADLYLRPGRDKVGIEIKAPAEMHWPARLDASADDVKAAVVGALRRARSQLGEAGALVVATGIAVPGFSTRLEEGITRALHVGRNRSIGVVAGISPMPPTLKASGAWSTGDLNFVSILNPGYSGKPQFVNDLRSLKLISKTEGIGDVN